MRLPAELLTDVPPSAAYATVFGLVLLESVLFVGSFVPTLSLLVCAGALARAGVLHLPLVIATAVTGVVTGDLVAQRTGRRLSDGLLHGRLGRRVPAAARERVAGLIRRRGGPALLVCRFVPVVRTFAPYLAGAAGLRYRQLAPYSLAAATVWASAEAGAGYAAGASYGRLAARLGGAGALGVTAGVLLLGAVTVLVLRRRARRSGAAREEAAVGAEHREVEPVQVGAGVDAEFGAEEAAHLGVHLQGLAPAAAAVEGQHQLVPQPFVEGELGGERAQTGDDLVMVAQREAHVVVPLPRTDPFLRESLHHVTVQHLGPDVGEGPAAPQQQGVGQQGPLALQVAEAARGACPLRQLPETVQVEGARRHVDAVSAGRGVQQP
nr:DedA family protein [Streptomyces sp. ET3-23]